MSPSPPSSGGREPDFLSIKGAREHNLAIDYLGIPKRQLVVFTGVSGSGKSSLAFDTLYAEGQRRYVESLSAYARQFLGQMEKPKYDQIRGLSPTIAIEQKSASSNPRSTVGTVTEIYDYLRVLYARAGEQRCHLCGGAVSARSAAEIVDELMGLDEGSKVTLLAPQVENRKGEFRELFDRGAQGRLRPRAHRRDDRPARGRRGAREEEEAHHRDRGRPHRHQAERAAAHHRLGRDRATRGQGQACRGGRGGAHAARLQRGPRLPQVRRRLSRAVAAVVLVQLAARHVRRLQRPGRAHGGRSGPRGARPRALHPRRRHRPGATRSRRTRAGPPTSSRRWPSSTTSTWTSRGSG